MKKMTCAQLGGACEVSFTANTFEEIGEMSKKHGIEMYQKVDAEHILAMSKMMDLMKSQENFNIWYNSKRMEFESLPDMV